jgi:DNA invertase Pin-like site-specific DNA recombinase
MRSRVIALLRCSTEAQDLEHQRTAVDDWAARQNPPVDLEFREEPATSGAAKSRPVLDAILADARRGRFDVLVVAALDRLGRDVVRIVMALDDLQHAGVRLVSLREGLDFGGPMGRAMAALLGAIAEMERASIRDRIRSGLRTARAKGRVLGEPPLVWREQELEELRELRAAGHSLSDIQRNGLVKVFDARGATRVPSVRSLRRALKAARAARSGAVLTDGVAGAEVE